MTLAFAARGQTVIQDIHGEAQGFAVVLVNAPDETMAVLYTDRTKGTTLANPTVTDGFGQLVFFSDQLGVYTLFATTGAGTFVRQVEAVVDPADDAYAADVAANAAAITANTTAIAAEATTARAAEATNASAIAGETATRIVQDALLIPLTQKAAANGVATLDSTSKIPVAQLPPLATNDFLGTAASQAAMLALVGQRGDWCVRTDLTPNHVFTLIGDDPTQVANWHDTGSFSLVNTVAGRVGDVVLSESDITGLVTDLAAKAADSAVLHLAGNETSTGTKSFDAAITKRAPWVVTHPGWGAVGDGATDATSAIQAAIDDCANAGGGDVIIPPGTFIVHQVSTGGVCLRARPNVTLRGLGPVSVIKRRSGETATDSRLIATPGIGTGGYTTPLQYFKVRDLCLDGNIAGNTTGHADHWHSIFLSGAIDCSVENCLFINSPGDGVFMHGGAISLCFRTRIRGNTFVGSTRVPVNFHGCADSVIDDNIVYGSGTNWCMKAEYDVGNQARWGVTLTSNVLIGYSGISVSGRPTAMPLNASVAAGDTTFQLNLDTAYSDGVVTGTTNLESDSANWVAGDVGRAITGDNIPDGTTIVARVDAQNVTLSNAVQPNSDGTMTNFIVVGRQLNTNIVPLPGTPATIENEQVLIQSVNTSALPYIATIQRPFQAAHSAGVYVRLGYATDIIIAHNRMELSGTGGGGVGVQLAGMQRSKVDSNDIQGGLSQSIALIRDSQNVDITQNTCWNLSPISAIAAIDIGGGTMTGDVWKLTHAGTLTSGTVPFTVDGQPSASVPYNATLAQIKTALEGLSQVGAGNVLVTGAATLDATTTLSPITITFQKPRSNYLVTTRTFAAIDNSSLVGGTVTATRVATSGVMYPISDITVARNTVIAAPQYGITIRKTAGEVNNVQRVKVVDNTVLSAVRDGILLNGGDDAVVANNTFSDCGGGGTHSGIRFANTAQARAAVRNNLLVGSTNQTIGVLADTGTLVSDVEIGENTHVGITTPVSGTSSLQGTSILRPQRLLSGSGAVGAVLGTLEFPSNVLVDGTLAVTGTATAPDPTLSTQVATKNYTDSATQAGNPTFSYGGPLAVATGQSRWTAETSLTIAAVRATVGTAPTGAAIVLDIKKNGVSIYTTTANRPTIAISGFTTLAALPDTVTLVAGDYLTVDILTVGSTISGSDLTAQIHVRKT